MGGGDGARGGNRLGLGLGPIIGEPGLEPAMLGSIVEVVSNDCSLAAELGRA